MLEMPRVFSQDSVVTTTTYVPGGERAEAGKRVGGRGILREGGWEAGGRSRRGKEEGGWEVGGEGEIEDGRDEKKIEGGGGRGWER